MTIQELIDVWDELHVKDTGELGFCDLVNAVEKVVGITNNGVNQPLCPEVWSAEHHRSISENQQSNS